MLDEKAECEAWLGLEAAGNLSGDVLTALSIPDHIKDALAQIRIFAWYDDDARDSFSWALKTARDKYPDVYDRFATDSDRDQYYE